MRLYAALEDPPPIIDLSGGQPDLVPEWVLWTMEALEAMNLERRVYLWSDDNLSNDYFWRHLSEPERERITAYPLYGRVCCFKGIDPTSFSFNTAANAALFDRQFDLFRRLLSAGLELFAYVTFPVPERVSLRDRVLRFVDRLQGIHDNLPLRTVPLEIEAFSPVVERLDEVRRRSIDSQREVLDYWMEAIVDRYSSCMREIPISDVPMGRAHAA